VCRSSSLSDALSVLITPTNSSSSLNSLPETLSGRNIRAHNAANERDDAANEGNDEYSAEDNDPDDPYIYSSHASGEAGCYSQHFAEDKVVV
jgi:hypothetical protein